jgi:hypothetical protein
VNLCIFDRCFLTWPRTRLEKTDSILLHCHALFDFYYRYMAMGETHGTPITDTGTRKHDIPLFSKLRKTCIITVFPKVENPCLTFGQASKKNCRTEKYDKNSGQFSFCIMQHTCITPQYLQNIN